MRLELGHVLIKDVQFGSETKIENGVLFVNKEELLKLIREDEHLASVDVEIAKPGESVRITPVKDVVEPRVKVEGPGG
ncbi:MAG: glycine/sarcosine/betaine reductase component B subunit, partial [Tissierellaceae bacterium]